MKKLLRKYLSRNCSTGALCYRTYEPSQSPAGCLSESHKSELCCEIRVDPYKDVRYRALQLRQPDTVVVFRYSVYEWTKTRWRLANEEPLEVLLNQGATKYELGAEHRVLLKLSGSRPNRELQAGVRESEREKEKV